MGDIIHLVPPRYNFPSMYIPVEYNISRSTGKLEIAGGDRFDIASNFNNINIYNINSDKIFIGGPSHCYTESIGWKPVVGIDNIDLFLTTDTFSDFNMKISENGFMETEACVGQMDKIDESKKEISPTINIFDGTKIFEMGNYLIKKYPLRQGTAINFNHFVSSAPAVACIIFMPKKRDRTTGLALIVEAENEEELKNAIIQKIIETDPKKNIYLRTYVAEFFGENKDRCIGFFEVAAHLTVFQFDAKMRLQGLPVKEN